MCAGSSPGPIGTDPFSQAGTNDAGHPHAGFRTPGHEGGDPIPLADGDRLVVSVSKDWVPPKPKTTPEIVVNGATLALVAEELNKLPEWGRGGGSIRVDEIPVGTSPTVAVTMHANLLRALPRWSKRDKASAAAQAEWDRMLGKLAIHEDRHMEIAVEEADNLAKALIGVEILEIGKMVTAANKTMQDRQDQLDTDTNHGEKAGVKYGDVFLDTTIA